MNCKKCGDPITDANVQTLKRRLADGSIRLYTSGACYPCFVARIKAWARANKDKRNATMRRHRAKNPEKWRAYGRRWKKEHRASETAGKKLWCQKNRERFLEWRRRWYRRKKSHILYLQKMNRLDRKARQMLKEAGHERKSSR